MADKEREPLLSGGNFPAIPALEKIVSHSLPRSVTVKSPKNKISFLPFLFSCVETMELEFIK
jgi:hypothetical protein